MIDSQLSRCAEIRSRSASESRRSTSRGSRRYLHVYATAGEPERALTGARPGLYPVSVFLHANLAEEVRLRREFARVHVCRRFSIAL